MKVEVNKKALLILAAVAVAAWFILTNTVLSGFSGTYKLHDEREWVKLSYEVREGDANKFTAALDGPHTVKVKYSGEYPFQAELRLETGSGEAARYELLLYQERDMSTDSWQIESELNEIGQSVGT